MSEEIVRKRVMVVTIGDYDQVTGRILPASLDKAFKIGEELLDMDFTKFSERVYAPKGTPVAFDTAYAIIGSIGDMKNAQIWDHSVKGSLDENLQHIVSDTHDGEIQLVIVDVATAELLARSRAIDYDTTQLSVVLYTYQVDECNGMKRTKLLSSEPLRFNLD